MHRRVGALVPILLLALATTALASRAPTTRERREIASAARHSQATRLVRADLRLDC